MYEPPEAKITVAGKVIRAGTFGYSVTPPYHLILLDLTIAPRSSVESPVHVRWIYFVMRSRPPM